MLLLLSVFVCVRGCSCYTWYKTATGPATAVQRSQGPLRSGRAWSEILQHSAAHCAKTGTQLLLGVCCFLLACLFDCLLAYLVYRLIYSTVVEQRKLIKLLDTCVKHLHLLAVVIY